MHIRLIRVLIAVLLLASATPALARGPWRADETNTRGWQFMTPEERIAHQIRVRGFRTYAECRDYQLEHHRLLEERARERGLALPGGGRDFCEHLKTRGE